MLRRFLTGLCLIFVCFSVQAEQRVTTPFYGGGLYQFFQGNYFSAIVELEAARAQWRLLADEPKARLLLGGLYLAYGMHREAEAVFEKLLYVQQTSIRDQAWLFMAKIRYQRGYFTEARAALAKIEGVLPPGLVAEQQTLASLLAFELNDGSVMGEAELAEVGLPFAEFNRDLFQLRFGDQAAAIKGLEKLAEMEAPRYEQALFVDRVNLVLGEHFLAEQQFAQAQQHLRQVTLGGAFSNRALLALGWVALGAGDRVQALTAWQPLQAGPRSDPAVQESYLAIAYLYFQSRQFDQALDHYSAADTFYQAELARIDELLAQSSTIATLAELAEPDGGLESGWRWQAEVAPQATLDFYLIDLMTRNEFQEALKSYRDLRLMRDNLDHWRDELATFDEMQALRYQAFQDNLFKVEQYMAEQSPEANAAMTEMYRQQLAAIDESQNEFALRSRDEDALLQHMKQLRQRAEQLGDALPDRANYLQRLRILEGMVTWQLLTDYPARRWQVEKQLKALSAAEQQNAAYRQEIADATQGQSQQFDDYRRQLRGHAQQVDALAQQVEQTLTQLEAYLQTMLDKEMTQVKARLQTYRSQALVSIAHIRDLQLERQLNGGGQGHATPPD